MKMRKKMWIASPMLYLAIVAMFVMSLFSYENKTSFIIQMSITALFAISVLFLQLQFKFHTKNVLKSAKKILMVENEQALSELSMPIVVTGLEGDIMWNNSSFGDAVSNGQNVFGENVMKFIYPKTLKQVLGEKGANVKYRNKQFTVYAVKTGYSLVFYFVDDTYFKEIHKEYIEKKTVVALISFDNKEELVRGSGGGVESKITSEVENVLSDWADEVKGFMRKLSGGRYIMITDEAHIEKSKAKRFDILENVRQVKGKGDLSATISVGIGRDASSAYESEILARQALEMALGRGGDQIAMIKKGGKYEFFGGLSKGAEKRDQVRTRVIAATLADQIKSSDKVFIMGHRNSDLDSMGSAIGMWSVITNSLKKNAFIVVNQHQTLAEPLIDAMVDTHKEKRVFISPTESLQEVTEKTLIIIVDTHSSPMVEEPELLKATEKIVIIDHHRMVVNYIKNPIIFYHEPYASSASEMVSELIQYIDSASLGVIEAQALLSGIMLDTKNFVLKTGVRTFEASAYLKRMGADTVKVKQYFSNSISSYREKSQLISTAQVYKECAIASTEEMTANTRVAAAQAADELLAISGVKASFVLFGADREINISARSLGDINVQLILEEFGGGGHLTMAGAQVRGKDMQDVKTELVEVINEKLNLQENH